MATYTFNAKALKATFPAFDRITTKSTYPLFENLFIQVNPDGLTMMRTDCDLIITCGPEPTNADWFTVNYKQFKGAIRAQTTPLIDLEFGGTADHASIKINGAPLYAKIEPDANIPEPLCIKDSRTLVQFVLTPADLATMLPPLLAVVPDDDTRYYLNGALFDIKSGALTVVASDGHRLCKFNRQADVIKDADDQPITASAILPENGLRALNTLLKLAEPVRVTIRGDGNTHNRFIFETLGERAWRLDSRAIDGCYPNLDRVFNEKTCARVELERGDMLTALNELKPFITPLYVSNGKKTKSYPVRVQAKRMQNLTLAHHDGTFAKRVDAAVDCDFETGYEIKYLIDAISTLPKDADQIAINFKGDSKLFLVEHGPVTSLVMPTRL